MGPMTRRGLRNDSVVLHSTTMRADRSQRLQTVAESYDTSPLATPWEMSAREPLMMAGAATDLRTRAGAVMMAALAWRRSVVNFRRERFRPMRSKFKL